MRTPKVRLAQLGVLEIIPRNYLARKISADSITLSFEPSSMGFEDKLDPRVFILSPRKFHHVLLFVLSRAAHHHVNDAHRSDYPARFFRVHFFDVCTISFSQCANVISSLVSRNPSAATLTFLLALASFASSTFWARRIVALLAEVSWTAHHGLASFAASNNGICPGSA
jgi:hypothetical protein